MRTFLIGGKIIDVFTCQSQELPIIYLNTVSTEGQTVFEAAQAYGSPPFALVAIRNLDWNHDMAPWDCPSVFKNSASYTGGANKFLRLMTEEIIPIVEKEINGFPRWRGIVGYSLAGLFALYAVYQTDVFNRVGSISGSLWFPKIKEYIFSHVPTHWPDSMYFSLGDKESNTKNPALQSVQQNTEDIFAFYRSKGINTVLQLNPGNHYNHAIERIAAGVAWMLNR